MYFQGDAIAFSDILSAQMSEVLRKCDALGIESDIIDRGKRLNALTVLKMQRRIELAQLASSTDLDELEHHVRNVVFQLCLFSIALMPIKLGRPGQR